MSARAIEVSMASVSTKAVSWPLNLPAGSLVGVLESPVRIPEALAGLSAAGIERRSVEIISRIDDGSPRSNSLASTVMHWLARVGPERELSQRYRKEVADGRVLLVIRGLPADLQAQAGDILRSAGGHSIHVYGRFTVRTLAA